MSAPNPHRASEIAKALAARVVNLELIVDQLAQNDAVCMAMLETLHQRVRALEPAQTEP